ncbi:MAG: ATP synthase F0 subunit B [Desulfovibrio sp.]|jgi:F-type H+-transporting ATPase subunit b|nr:ATP synthase F0 subunit B [Desulfovibrio sp.]
MSALFAATLIVTLYLTGVPALAEDGHEAPRWDDFAWRILNIIIFVGILWYFAGKLAVNFFRGRRRTISDTLANLEQRRADAGKELSAVEERIASLTTECEAILEQGRQQAELLKAGIVADAQRQAEQILAHARLTAENEGRAVMAQVRAVMADEIVDAAEKALRAKLNAAEHEKLIVNSLNKVVLH